MMLLSDIGDPHGLRRLLELAWAEERRRFEGGPEGRKRGIAERLMIDAERHLSLVRRRIAQVYETPQAREAIGLHADRRNNLLKQVGDRVAIAYNTPPARIFREANEAAQRAFLDAYREARTDIHASTWGRNAWLCNVVHVLPRFEVEGLRWVTVLPHAADVIFDPAGEERPSILVYATSSMGAKYVAVDAERWWWVDERWQVIADEEHGLGRRPWAEFRVAAPPADDYWDRGRRSGLVEGTLELTRIGAHMGWARKISSKDAPYIIIDPDAEMPARQMMNGEDPVYIRGTAELGTLKLVLPVKEFKEEMGAIRADAAGVEGVPVGVVDERLSSDRVTEHDALKKKRNAQIMHLEMGEFELARLAVGTLRRHGSPAGALDPSRFAVRYADLTYADTPKERVENTTAQMKLGATNPYEHYMRENPGTTPEEARREVHGNLEAYTEFLDFVTTRQLPMDVSRAMQTLPQTQGATAGRTAQEPGQDDDDDDDDVDQ